MAPCQDGDRLMAENWDFRHIWGQSVTERTPHLREFTLSHFFRQYQKGLTSNIARSLLSQIPPVIEDSSSLRSTPSYGTKSGMYAFTITVNLLKSKNI
ncbi:hypothetical protein J6590_084747 [Homalodisca vitripennis]|nr:hypothetical protein J6590_084747 [Homalodisca vitripennis]